MKVWEAELQKVLQRDFMIKANELRIGNFVKYSHVYEDDVNVIIDSIDPENKFIKDCEAIPLTKEWLLKFGFELDNENPLNEIQKRYYLTVPITGSAKTELIFRVNTTGQSFGSYNVDSFWASNNFQYVHQLQNLYFAITGEELTVKELNNNGTPIPT